LRLAAQISLCCETNHNNNDENNFDNDNNEDNCIIYSVCHRDVADDAYPNICVADREKYVWHVVRASESVNEPAWGTYAHRHTSSLPRVPSPTSVTVTEPVESSFYCLQFIIYLSSYNDAPTWKDDIFFSPLNFVLYLIITLSLKKMLVEHGV